MRTALLTGLITGAALAVLNYGYTLSNADFIYMCAAAALLKQGILLATPYFPPGYPLALYGVMQSGLGALTAGMALSALGGALCAGALAYTARLWRVPPVVALLLGLLAISLPDVFDICCNPHLDALYTGLAMVLLACALRALHTRPHFGIHLLAALCAMALLLLRYHAVLLVFPLALVLLFTPRSRALGLTLLICGVAATGYAYWALYACTGALSTAAGVQISTGATYRAQGSDTAVMAIFNDYAAWLQTRPQPTLAVIWDGILQNWPQFLLRKAVLLGAGLWLLAGLVQRRAMPGSVWLLPFIAGYTLAISPTYFMPRASALPELAGLLLCAAALGTLFFDVNGGGKRGAKQAPLLRLDPAVMGMIVCALLLGGLGYDGWRLYRDHFSPWRASERMITTANKHALREAGGKRVQLYGALDLTAWPDSGSYNLPGAVYSRWWMDDPAVSPALEKLIPKYSPEQVALGQTPVRAVLVWSIVHYPQERKLAELLALNPLWREVDSGTPEAKLYVRR